METEALARELIAQQLEVERPRLKKPRPNLSRRKIFLILGEMVALIIATATTLIVWQIYSGLDQFAWEVLALCGLWLVFAMVTDAYGMATFRNRKIALFQPLYNTLLIGIVITVVYFFTPNHYPRASLSLFCVITCSLVFAWRFSYFIIFPRKPMQERVMLLGKPKYMQELEKLLACYPHCYEVVATIATANFRDLKQISAYDVDEIIYADCKLPSNHLLKQLIRSRARGINFTLAPLWYESFLGRTPSSYLQGCYSSFLPAEGQIAGSVYTVAKRAMDFALTLIGAAFFLPLLPLLALAIKLDSRGPIFYSQLRVGQNGRHFKLWKLRTMVTEAEYQGPMWTENGDKRVTRVGKILRKIHLDEFPQLWNVFKGDISIVGVRPLTVEQCRQFARDIPNHDLRHLAKPGVTGWAVVQFRHVNDLEGATTRLEYDLYYIRHQSCWLDLFIICRTAWIILTGKGI
jgi:exopolysaccharide biosynthesis polyprenyl glycosylphosphotransferase